MATDPLAGKTDDQNVWVENLLTGDSNYRSDRAKDSYPMMPNGVQGSVISVPVKVAKEAFFRRAVSRGNLRLLTDEEASIRESELSIPTDSSVDEADRIMKSLEEGASEVGARYAKKGLSDDGTERQSISAKEILNKSQKAKKGGATTVRRSETNKTEDEPVVIEAVVTEPVKEGDWVPDTGV